MAPTRELAQQIEVEFRKLARYTGVSSLSVVGGTNIQVSGGHAVTSGGGGVVFVHSILAIQ